MQLLINIHSSDFLHGHEALSMAFALAAFDHQVQLSLSTAMLQLLTEAPEGKLAHMLASLDLYDMPAAWLTASDFQRFDDWQSQQRQRYEWCSQLAERPNVLPNFDTIFNL